MREPKERRLFLAVLFALVAGALLAAGNPVDRLKADLRADAKGFAISLEYSARMIGVQAPAARTILSIGR